MGVGYELLLVCHYVLVDAPNEPFFPGPWAEFSGLHHEHLLHLVQELLLLPLGQIGSHHTALLMELTLVLNLIWVLVVLLVGTSMLVVVLRVLIVHGEARSVVLVSG